MNRSFSKIRHIQEANLNLEKRVISEQTKVQSNNTFENTLDGFMKWHDLFRGRRENFDLTQQGNNFVSKSKLQNKQKIYKFNPTRKQFDEVKNDDKQNLIQVLRDKLISMESDNKFDANAVADTIINNCNNFKNKKDIFA